jgi:PAS domain S-box-containing protein
MRRSVDRRAPTRPVEGARRPCDSCTASMRFHERYTVMHGVESVVLPAWVCDCGGEVFVRGAPAALSEAAKAPTTSERCREELRRWLARVRTQASLPGPRAQPARERAQDLMRLHADSLVSVAAADDTGRYVAANPAVCALLGFAHDDLLHLTIWDVSAAPPAPRREEHWKAFIERGCAEGRHRLRRRTGEAIVVNYAAVSCVFPGVHIGVMATRALLQHLYSRLS